MFEGMEHREFIDSLGGTLILARLVGVRAKAAWNWHERGIPWRFRPAIADFAKDRGVEVPTDFLDATPRAA